MPKRLLDDSLLSSPSLAKLSPGAQDAFPRFILLADDFGCFDASARVLLGKGWPLREDVTERKVAGWIGEYERSGMLFLWDEGGRRYGYLTGWHGEHGQKHRLEYVPKNLGGDDKAQRGSKRRTPRPPGFDPADSRFVPARESAGLTPGGPRVPGQIPDTQFQSQSQSQYQSQANGSVQPQIDPSLLGGAGGNV
jgi:hypothetical protein